MLVFLAAALWWPANAATMEAREGPNPVSPIVVSPVPQHMIVPVLGTDERYHVLYELQLTNTLSSAADLRSFEVIDARNGNPLLKLGAADILKGEYLHMLDRKTANSTSFRPFEGRVLILNLSFDAKGLVPPRLIHRFVASGAEPFSGQAAQFDYRGGAVEIASREPPVLSPPLEGTGWLVSDGCCGPTGHINALVGLDGRLQGAERFAIDWIKMDEAGRIVTGDQTKLENWVGYGAKVLSVGSGVLTAASDEQQEHAPGAMPDNLPLAKLPGNYVTVRLDSGFTALYAHLKPGSIKLKTGDRVSAGDVLGELGNTGGSLAPHLHFHIVNGPSGFASDGYPYVVDALALAAKGDPTMLLPALDGKEGFPHRGQMRPAERKRELPLNFDIVDFPPAR